MPRLPKAALHGGLIAGTHDIGAVCLINGVRPAPILRYLASGLLGQAGVAGGGPGIRVLGLMPQWATSILIAGIYDFAAERLPALARRQLLTGLAYGRGIGGDELCRATALCRTESSASVGLNLVAMLAFGQIVAAPTRQAFKSRL